MKPILSLSVVLLILLVGTGWYAISLQNEVAELRAQNQDLRNTVGELQQAITSLQQEISVLKNEKDELTKELDEIGVEVDLLIDFGNGTRLWFNDTLLPYGATLLNATLLKAYPVKYSTSDLGAFVEEVMGVSNSNPYYWIWWEFQNGEWVIGEVAADMVLLRDGEVYAWKYSDTSVWPPESP